MSSVSQNTSRQNIRLQRVIAITGVVLFAVKIFAWSITGSVAVLTDALESVVNVVSAFIGLYSLGLSSRPRDRNHPYGHGKVEFISAGIEGALITVAGLVIVYEAVMNFRYPHILQDLDMGMALVVGSAVLNFVLGRYAIRAGRRTNSLALVSSGRHLQTDTWSTAGIVAGLVLIRFTGLLWIDSAVALVFSGYIIYTGYRIVRESLAGIMDEADEKLIGQLVQFLESNRRVNWIDLHNLRIIKYGSILHLDCHLTVPWYFNVHQAHDEVEELANLVRTTFGDSVELFVHTDGCLDFSCGICQKQDCVQRQSARQGRILWTVQNVMDNRKHRMGQ